MAVELATAYISLVPSLQGAQGKIAEEFGGAGASAGSSFGATFGGTFLGNLAAGVFRQAGAAVGKLFTTGFAEAKDAEVATAQLTAGIKSTGNAANVTVAGLNEVASAIQSYSGQTDDSIAKTQGLLLTFTNIKNVGVNRIFDDATRAAADMAARFGGDASSQAVVLGKALNDPVQGVTALTRAGVQFTDQQKDQIKTLVESGDILGAQKIILGELSTQFGGSAEAFGNTFPGAVERVKRAFEDFSQSTVQGVLPLFTPILIGIASALQDLAPVAERIGGAITSGLGSAIEFLGPLFGQIAETVGPLIGQFFALYSSISPLGLIFQAIQPFLPQLLDAFLGLAQVVGGALGAAMQQLLPVFQQLGTVISGALGTALTTLLPIITTVVGLLGPVISTVLSALMPIIVTLAGIFGKLVGAVLPLLTPILGLIAPLAELVAAILPPIVKLFAALLEPILALISPLIDLLVPILGFLVGILTTVIGVIVDVITWLVQFATGGEDASDQFQQAFAGIGQFFSDMWRNILQFFVDGIQGIVGFFTGLPGKILSAVGNLGNLLVASGQSLIQGFIDGIKAMIGAVGNAVGGVMDFVAGFFPHSPAERGPFSGSGWTDVRNSGIALGEQFGLGWTDSTQVLAADISSTFRGQASSLTTGDTTATAASVGFANYGTITTVDVDALVDEVETRKRRANAFAGIGTGDIR